MDKTAFFSTSVTKRMAANVLNFDFNIRGVIFVQYKFNKKI